MKKKMGMNSYAQLDLRILVYICEDCGAPFNIHQDYTDHSMMHNKAEIHVCEHCGMPFHEIDSLNKHTRLCEHHTTSNYDYNANLHLCEQCGQPFNDLSEFNDHVDVVHSGNSSNKEMENLSNVFICDQCGMLFNSSAGLEEHTTFHYHKVISNNQLYLFDRPIVEHKLSSLELEQDILLKLVDETNQTNQVICKENLKSMIEPEVSSISRVGKPVYLRKSSCIKRLTCSKCGTRLGLVEKIKEHTNTFYKCCSCVKMYLAKDTLEKHMKTKHKIKCKCSKSSCIRKLKCSKCGTRIGLVEKIKEHTNMFYKCCRCVMMYSAKDTVEKHMKTKHKIECKKCSKKYCKGEKRSRT